MIFDWVKRFIIGEHQQDVLDVWGHEAEERKEKGASAQHVMERLVVMARLSRIVTTARREQACQAQILISYMLV